MSDKINLTRDNIQIVICKKMLVWHEANLCDPNLKGFDVRYLAHIREDVAHAMVGELLFTNAIRFYLSPFDEKALTRSFEARMAVVNPELMQTFEDRIHEKADAMMEEAVEAAFYEIDRWGSHYGVTTISKADAKSLLREGLRRVMARKTTEVRAEPVASADGGR